MTGQIITAKAPVVLAAALSNSVRLDSTYVSDNMNISIVPTSVMDTAYVSFYSSEHLAKIAPSGVSDEVTGVCGYTQALVVDGADSPALFAITQDPGTRSMFDSFSSFWTRAQPTWSADFVAKAVVTTGGYGLVTGSVGVGAFIGAAGQVRALVSYIDLSSLSIGDRIAPGRWTGTSLTSYGSYPIAVLDSLGRQRILYLTTNSGGTYHYNEWIDGKTIQDFRGDGTSINYAAAAGPSGMLAVARVTQDGVVVTFSDGTTVGDDHLVAGTPPPGGDPCYRKLSSCQPTVCEWDGVIPGTVALASTSDGALWLAYRHEHRTDEYTVNGINTQDCWTLSKTSATVDLQLVRLSADGSSTPSTAWRYTMSGSSTTGSVVVDESHFGMAAHGSRLFLAIPNHDVVDVFVIDATRL